MGVKMIEYAEGVDTQFYKILKTYKRLQDDIKSETDLRKRKEKEKKHGKTETDSNVRQA